MAPGLTEGDKAMCAEIAREIVKEVLKEHIASCPHGMTLLKSKSFIIGCIFASGICGGLGGGGLVAILLKAL